MQNSFLRKVSIVSSLLGLGTCGYVFLKKKKKGNHFSKIHMPVQKISYSPHYVSYYDHKRRIPLCVEEIITKKKIEGKAQRKNCFFREDKNIPRKYRSTLEDYKGSFPALGLHRGHMSAAGNFKSDQEGMCSTFLLSNILPQNGDNNGDLWNSFEMWCRELTGKYDKVRIISGPVFLAKDDECAEGMLKTATMNFKTIGKSYVHVPTHLYKIVCGEKEKSGKKKEYTVFVMPNEESSDNNVKFGDFAVTLDYLESVTGFNFPDLKDISPDLCKNNPICSKMSKGDFDLGIIRKNFYKETTLNGMAYTEAWLKRKKIDINNTPNMKERIVKEFNKTLKNHSKENDSCIKVEKLVELNKILQNSHMNENKEYTDKVVKMFLSALKECKDESVRGKVHDTINHYWYRNSVLSKNNDVRKELEV